MDIIINKKDIDVVFHKRSNIVDVSVVRASEPVTLDEIKQVFDDTLTCVRRGGAVVCGSPVVPYVDVPQDIHRAVAVRVTGCLIIQSDTMYFMVSSINRQYVRDIQRVDCCLLLDALDSNKNN